MRLANFKLTLLLFFAERLRNWADSVEGWAIEDQERPSGEPVGSPDIDVDIETASESDSYSSPPADWARLTATGPPPHWVELVKQKAPELLFPLQDDIVPVQPSGDLSEEDYSESRGDTETDNPPREPGEIVAQKTQSQPKDRTRKTQDKGKSFVRPSRLPFKCPRVTPVFAKPSASASDREDEHSIPQSVERSEQEQGTESPSVGFYKAQKANPGEKDRQISAPASKARQRGFTLDRTTRTSSSKIAPQPQVGMDLQETERTARRMSKSSLKDFSRRTNPAQRPISTEEIRRAKISAAGGNSSAGVLQKTGESPAVSESTHATRHWETSEPVTLGYSTADALPVTAYPAFESQLRATRSTRSANQSERVSQPRVQTSGPNLPTLMDEETMNEAPSVRSTTTETDENPWPDLPSAPALEIGDEVAARERQMERLERLEREQRGTLWSA